MGYNKRELEFGCSNGEGDHGVNFFNKIKKILAELFPFLRLE